MTEVFIFVKVCWHGSDLGMEKTPDSTGLKGDKLVGNYYVKFNSVYREEVAKLLTEGIDEKVAKKEAPILLKAQEMLKKWEDGDAETEALWEKMNQWVYDGFKVTYKNLGVNFDTLYYESKHLFIR